MAAVHSRRGGLFVLFILGLFFVNLDLSIPVVVADLLDLDGLIRAIDVKGCDQRFPFRVMVCQLAISPRVFMPMFLPLPSQCL